MLCPAIHNIPNQIIDEVADENYINWNVKHSTRNSLKIPWEASQKMNYCKYNFSWRCRGKKRVIAAVKFDEQLIFWSLGAWYVRWPKICRHVLFFFFSGKTVTDRLPYTARVLWQDSHADHCKMAKGHYGTCTNYDWSWQKWGSKKQTNKNKWWLTAYRAHTFEHTHFIELQMPTVNCRNQIEWYRSSNCGSIKAKRLRTILQATTNAKALERNSIIRVNISDKKAHRVLPHLAECVFFFLNEFSCNCSRTVLYSVYSV